MKINPMSEIAVQARMQRIEGEVPGDLTPRFASTTARRGLNMGITLPAFTPIEESLFLTLCGRALDNRSPHPILGDTMADEIVRYPSLLPAAHHYRPGTHAFGQVGPKR